MNRRIKFRVWNKKKQEWIHGPHEREDLDGVNLFGEMILFSHLLDGVSIEDLNEIEALQFTGLTDKNGKEIFEGDILCMPNDEPLEYGNILLVVEYRGAGFVYKDLFKKTDVDSIHSLIGFAEKDEEAEIIGNIFENPELLK